MTAPLVEGQRPGLEEECPALLQGLLETGVHGALAGAPWWLTLVTTNWAPTVCQALACNLT